MSVIFRNIDHKRHYFSSRRIDTVILQIRAAVRLKHESKGKWVHKSIFCTSVLLLYYIEYSMFVLPLPKQNPRVSERNSCPIIVVTVGSWNSPQKVIPEKKIFRNLRKIFNEYSLTYRHPRKHLRNSVYIYFCDSKMSSQ